MLWIFKTAGEKNSNNTTYQFWRQDNQAKELVSNKFKEQKLDYIHKNPVEAGIVDIPENYLYSSARNYCEQKGKTINATIRKIVMDEVDKPEAITKKSQKKICFNTNSLNK